VRIALAQIDPIVGDLEGNVARIEAAVAEARGREARLVAFPEMAITGYPPQDLLYREGFVRAARRALDGLVSRLADGPALVVGLPVAREEPGGRALYNAAALVAGGSVALVHKRLLPTYDVFDEDRYFEAGGAVQPVLELDGVRIGVTICEDMWNPGAIGSPRRPHRPLDPVSDVAARADVLLNVSASPYDRGKVDHRRDVLVRGHARRHGKPFLFVSQVGGNDELLFDGTSCAADAEGVLRARAPMFREALLVVDVDPATGAVAGDLAPRPATAEREVYEALVMGTRDYARKCGFDRALVGSSGGVDSALTVAVAAEAFGPGAVLGVTMPSRFSSEGSVSDSRRLADNLGVELIEVPIEPMFRAFLEQLEGPFEGRGWDVTEENIQARTRGAILMALSNKHGRLLLTTGNKSEIATGYCTLYGDMAGGLAVISDVPKTLVYGICRDLNRAGEVIPPAIIEKPPSAELAPDQRDDDSLPPYDVLDPILELYVEEQLGATEIAARGWDPAVVERIVGLVERSEYKRRQAAPGLKVTARAFGVGRRVPIAKRLTGLG